MPRHMIPKLGSWLLRNKRHNLVILTVLCALCLLLWRRAEPSTNSTDLTFHKGSLEIREAAATTLITSNARLQAAANDSHNLRRQHVISHCSRKHGDQWSSRKQRVPKFSTSPIISTKHGLMYCPVGKVASSYFTRYVITLDQPGPMTSPYDIPIQKAGRDRCQNLASLGNSDKAVTFLQKAVKVVFGRNPFSRVFSAYIDKVYSPNPFYWRYWGERAIHLSGQQVKDKCASEVTFKQFVAVVVKELVTKDVHLKPVYEECKMCDVIYDVVGKLETTTDDIDFLSASLNVSSAFQHDGKYSYTASIDTVLDAVESPFSWKKDIQACMSLDEMGQRIWRKLQIRGIIDSRISYPFKAGEVDAMPSTKFVSACRSAVEASKDRAQLKKQKVQAFLEAYATLTLEELRDIVRVYQNEFDVFEYDTEPPRLFRDRGEVGKTDFLNWRVNWQLL
ncbi:carbohydrate sulfotransferase 12 [Aplysia californica]|uniref:Carbohydrate sulfotransferase n=1 Tax=Aplysia californica TaxID=6500 RepID=A0ABM0JP03_APLCA|nr:carbohydrate sulfotransferase 12 [Aplysia californica]